MALLGIVQFAILIALLNVGLTDPLALTARAQAAVVFIGLSSGLAYFILLWALARATPTRVTMFQALAPITATALGIGLLGETVTAHFLAGLGAVVLGLVVALSAPRPAQ